MAVSTWTLKSTSLWEFALGKLRWEKIHFSPIPLTNPYSQHAPKALYCSQCLKSNKLAITEDRHPTCIHNQIMKNYISDLRSSHSYTETIKQQEQNSKSNLTSTAFSEALWNASEIIVGCSPLLSKFRHCFSKAPAKTTTASPKQPSTFRYHSESCYTFDCAVYTTFKS
jgi:hypothetical protein